MFEIGQKVETGLQTKNAEVRSIVKVNKKNPSATLYLVEYTMDDELERSEPSGRRHTQPFYGSELKAV